MKYLTLIFTLTLIVSCKKENPEENPEPDCNCDRVIQKTTFTMPYNCSGSPGSYSYGSVVTINDCTGIQINGNWSQCEGDAPPVAGECFNH